MRIATIAVLAACATTAGCMSDEYGRTQGLTRGAGDAIAANTVMQMVDPWPVGVNETSLSVPADLKPYRAGPPAAAPDQP